MNDYMICDYIADHLQKDEKLRVYFLKFASASATEKFAVAKEVIHISMSKLGVGEGLIRISCDKKGYIQAGYSNPIEKKGLVVTSKQCSNGKFHHKMATKDWCNSLTKWITYDMILKYLGVSSDLSKFSLDKGIENYAIRLFNGACNINPSFRRERFNLLLSLKEYEQFPDQLDADSIAGMNLTVVSEMLLRMTILEEDGEGNKKYLKKSDVDGNPLIRIKFEELVYRLAQNEIKPQQKNKKEEGA